MFRNIARLILILGATTAAATPPDTIYIEDRVFGVNETHIFFLRTTNDNLGLHIFGMKDTYLVAKNIDTRQDDQIWAVLRQHGAPDYHPDSGVPTPVIQTFNLTGAINPFKILAERGALHIEDPLIQEVGEGLVPLSDGGLSIEEFSLSLDDMADQMENAVAKTLSAIQPYPDGEYTSMTFSTPHDLLENWRVDPSQCSILGDIELSPIYGMRIVRLAKIECWDAENVQPASLYVILNPVIQVE